MKKVKNKTTTDRNRNTDTIRRIENKASLHVSEHAASPFYQNSLSGPICPVSHISLKFYPYYSITNQSACQSKLDESKKFLSFIITYHSPLSTTISKKQRIRTQKAPSTNKIV